MFLFHKKTRNVIKYIWGFFAIIIIFSMVFAFSGLGGLPSAPADQTRPIELSPEDIAALQQGGEGVELTQEEFAELQQQMPESGSSLGDLSPQEMEELRAKLMELDEDHELRGLLNQLPSESPTEEGAETVEEEAPQLDLSI